MDPIIASVLAKNPGRPLVDLWSDWYAIYTISHTMQAVRLNYSIDVLDGVQFFLLGKDLFDKINYLKSQLSFKHRDVEINQLLG